MAVETRAITFGERDEPEHLCDTTLSTPARPEVTLGL